MLGAVEVEVGAEVGAGAHLLHHFLKFSALFSSFPPLCIKRIFAS
jgi:hypothetical protein